jgi:hypothetical protein
MNSKFFFRCLARDESSNNTVSTATTTTITTTTTVPSNGEPQRRAQSVNRHHLDETIRRLSKPKNTMMTQSIHIGATASSLSPSTSNGIPLSHSSHQLRVPTPVATTNNHLTPTRASSNTRKVS